MGTPRKRSNPVRLRLTLLAGDQEVELQTFDLGPDAVEALRDKTLSWLRVAPRFSFERGQGVCRVVFEREPALFPERAGMDLIEWLLRQPDTEIHPLDLLARVAGEEPLRQRSAALDDAKATREHLARKARARATLESDEATEPEKNEAREELASLEGAEAEIFHRTNDDARKAARAARQSIQRAIESLAKAKDKRGQPDPVLQAFGAHLQRYLWDASRLTAKAPGRLVYRPPAGVKWA